MPRSPRNRILPLAVAAGGSPRSEAIGPGPETESRAQPSANEIDWSVLMARAQSGDSEAYRRLLQDIAPYLRSLAAKRHRDARDIEDAVQDVLLTVHAIRHTYDPSRAFGPWLRAIANRRIIDRLRRQTRTRSRETVLDPGHETFPAPQANLHEAAGDGRALREAVERLPRGQRQAIKLVKFEEMSLKEAASVTGMSVAALKAATHRALKGLRKMLGKRSGET
jgi:RNA polymerase sigma-70 factor (ECF subfamily)